MAVVIASAVAVGAVTIDNDGKAKSNPYGDSKLPSSFGSGAYYDCYIPYALTNEDVGGYAVNVVNYNGNNYKPMTEANKKKKVGVRTNYQGRYRSGSWHNCSISVEPSTGLQVATDPKGNKYYLTAIQEFFYRSSSVGSNNFYGWSSQNRGQLFDVVLTDGTVVHFAVKDTNAIQHTNAGGDDTEGTFDCKITYAPSKLPQYNHLFAAMAGNCLELWGSSSAVASAFMQKYNMGSNDNQNKIAYYRMYNLKIDNAPDRGNGVGKEVSYSLGSVTINGSTTESGDDDVQHTDSLGNSIVPETSLVGMENYYKNLFDNASTPSMAKREDLSIGEQYSTVVIGESVALMHEANLIDIVRVGVVCIGIILIFYAVLITISAVFDKANNFIDINLVGIVTFGLLKYSDDPDVKGKKGFVTFNRMVFVSGMLLLIGGSLISGGVLPVALNVISSVVSRFV